MAQGQSAPSIDAEAVRRALDALGQRRRAWNEEGEAIRNETREVLNLAHGVIPMTEACERAEIGRATVYQDYLRDRPAAA